MIKKKSERKGNIEIDLTGPEGNAFTLLGYAQKFGKQLNWDEAKQKAIMGDMRSGDYEHLVEAFDRQFGTFVTLLR